MKIRAIQDLVLFVTLCVYYAKSDDNPCIPRYEAAGQSYMCVCNSTYCDTVGRPVQLANTSYYYYKTSNSTPGFNKVVRKFKKGEEAEKTKIKFTINPSVEYQEIIGFGGSITDSVATVINYLPADAQEKVLGSYFGPDSIEYSMLRIPIGSTDFSTSDYTLAEVPYDNELQHFSLNDADYNLKIPLILKAMNMSDKAIKIFACTWVTPFWMKASSHYWNTYLNATYYDAFARYHVKFVKAYEQESVPIWAVSSPNEPMLLYTVSAIPSMAVGVLNFTMQLAPEQRTWMKSYLKPQLAANNLSHVMFLTLEDERPFAPYWMKRFGNDEEALSLLDGIALHSYLDWFVSPTVLDDLHETYPDKLLLITENSINDEYGFPALVYGSWYHAEAYLYNIFQNLDHWVQTYVDWNLALDMEGGPSRSQTLDCAILVNQTSGEFYKQPLFYAMGHASKFILPGAKKVQVTSNQKKEEVKNQLTMEQVFSSKLNRAKGLGLGEGIPLDIKIPQEVNCIAFTNPDMSFTVSVLNTMNTTVQVTIEDSRVGHIGFSAEQQSVNTFVYWP